MDTKTNKGYKFDVATETFTMTAAFAQKAGMLNTTEYRTLQKYRMDYPNMTIEKRHTTGHANKMAGLTEENMKFYLGKCRNSEQYLKVFATIKKLSKGQRSPKAFVRKWFNTYFTKYGTVGNVDAEGFVLDGEKLDKELAKKVLALPAPGQTIDDVLNAV